MSNSLPSPLSLGAESLARALGGGRAGGGWMARCPAHDDREPSLSIRAAGESRVLVHCHAGCTQGQVIAALRARGLWPQDGSRPTGPARSNTARRPAPTPPDRGRTAAALALWHAAAPAAGTLAQAYLCSRRIALPPPPSLRFHPGLRHPAGGRWPAMVALVRRASDGSPLAVHRTFLATDGTGKAPVQPQRMMLGPCGGGAVRLAEAGEVLMVGEGIETCLAAMQASGLPAWAALSAGGLRQLDLPALVREVIVLADGDAPSEAAARAGAARWIREGRRVRIARPPPGQDFNDMLANPAMERVP